jgi:hypothetical protein
MSREPSLSFAFNTDRDTTAESVNFPFAQNPNTYPMSSTGQVSAHVSAEDNFHMMESQHYEEQLALEQPMNTAQPVSHPSVNGFDHFNNPVYDTQGLNKTQHMMYPGLGSTQGMMYQSVDTQGMPPTSNRPLPTSSLSPYVDFNQPLHSVEQRDLASTFGIPPFQAAALHNVGKQLYKHLDLHWLVKLSLN